MRVTAGGAVLAVSASVLLAAAPASAAGDAKAELQEIALATSAASADGFVTRATWGGDNVSTYGAVGSGLTGENPEVTMVWETLDGKLVEIEKAVGNGGVTYDTYEMWKLRNSVEYPKSILDKVERTIVRMGGSDASLLPAVEWSPDEWEGLEGRVVFWELGTLVTRGLSDAGTGEVTKVDVADATVYRVTAADGEAVDVVVRNGLIDELTTIDGTESWETLARGKDVVVPDEAGTVLETRIALEASRFYVSVVTTRYVANTAAVNATANATLKGRKVTTQMVARALKEAVANGSEGPSRWTYTKSGKGYRLTASEKFPAFGTACVTLTPSGKKVLVRACS